MKNKTDSSWPATADFPIARPGIPFVCMACIATGLLFFVGWSAAAWVGVLITAFVCWFFRDPERVVPEDPKALVSPADGKIIIAEAVETNPYIDGACVKVSIFMNVFNVHVNRVPFSGTVEKTTYFPGRFFNASFDKASEENERNALVIRTDSGLIYGVVQIAGLVARRIVCKVKKGDSLERGRRYGMIRFGSRLDLYLPEDVELSVSVGDKVSAGSSVVGFLR